jgi:hypothetical protein
MNRNSGRWIGGAWTTALVILAASGLAQNAWAQDADAANAVQSMLPTGMVSTLARWANALLALQTLAKLIQPRVTEFMSRLFIHVLRSDDKADDAALVRRINSPWYFLANEVLDLVLRVKLPNADDLEAIREKIKATAVATAPLTQPDH